MRKGESKYPKVNTNLIKYCKCGCKNKITIQAHHNKYGVPDYIHGHNMQGRQNSCFEKNNKYSNNRKGKKNSKEHRRKIRMAHIKYVEEKRLNGLPLMPRIGKHEINVLNHIENKSNIKLIRQYPICGYFLDGYDKVNNVVYEIDEPYHNTQEQVARDKQRQLEIEQELGCQFVRIKVPN